MPVHILSFYPPSPRTQTGSEGSSKGAAQRVRGSPNREALGSGEPTFGPTPSSKGDSSELAWERGWTNRALHAPDRWSVQGIGPAGLRGARSRAVFARSRSAGIGWG